MKTFTFKIIKYYDWIALALVLFSALLMACFDPLFDNYTYLSYHRRYRLVYGFWVVVLFLFAGFSFFYLSYSPLQRYLIGAVCLIGILGALAPYTLEQDSLTNVFHVVLPNLSALGVICLLKFYLPGESNYLSLMTSVAILLVIMGYYTALVEFLFIVINIYFLRMLVKNNQIVG